MHFRSTLYVSEELGGRMHSMPICTNVNLGEIYDEVKDLMALILKTIHVGFRKTSEECQDHYNTFYIAFTSTAGSLQTADQLLVHGERVNAISYVD
jgi:hypothetical protein